ncbi:hypothetical protein CI41S_54480 [Bradyrhizobium ivorense]|nr:hypothetical protein CI41S_54480 [Bradyrhizobium ivorense]
MQWRSSDTLVGRAIDFAIKTYGSRLAVCRSVSKLRGGPKEEALQARRRSLFTGYRYGAPERSSGRRSKCDNDIEVKPCTSATSDAAKVRGVTSRSRHQERRGVRATVAKNGFRLRKIGLKNVANAVLCLQRLTKRTTASKPESNSSAATQIGILETLVFNRSPLSSAGESSQPRFRPHGNNRRVSRQQKNTAFPDALKKSLPWARSSQLSLRVLVARR